MILESECQKYTDDILVEKALINPDYYACLVNRYTEALRRYVVRLGGGTTDSEDILQEVFLNIYLRLNDFNKKFKFSSWIYRIAHNQTISAFRKANVKPTVKLEDFEPWQELVRESYPGAEFDREILKNKTKIILEQIDPKYREILILKFFEEKDYSEMSDILKKPMGTIATLVNRAKKKFAKLVKEELLN